MSGSRGALIQHLNNVTEAQVSLSALSSSGSTSSWGWLTLRSQDVCYKLHEFHTYSVTPSKKEKIFASAYPTNILWFFFFFFKKKLYFIYYLNICPNVPPLPPSTKHPHPSGSPPTIVHVHGSCVWVLWLLHFLYCTFHPCGYLATACTS